MSKFSVHLVGRDLREEPLTALTGTRRRGDSSLHDTRASLKKLSHIDREWIRDILRVVRCEHLTQATRVARGCYRLIGNLHLGEVIDDEW